MSIENLLARLEKVRESGNRQYLACCPAHADHSPSLSIRECDHGQVLINCFAGCAALDILGAVGLQFADLYPERLNHRLKPTRNRLSPRDGLQLLDREALVVCVVGSDILEHRKVDEATFKRLALSISRIGRVRDCIAPAKVRP